MSTPSICTLRVKIFADGADRSGMLEMAARPWIAGFTTNPTLMRKAGVTDYRAFAREIVAAIPDRPISFEVVADDPCGMDRQAREIASWGRNVYVKIPATNTRGDSMAPLVRTLTTDGISVNVTAVMTLDQVQEMSSALAGGAPSCVSVFGGRIADTGRDPLPFMQMAAEILAPHRQQQLVWASPREVMNIFHADLAGCHIITVTDDLLRKLPLVGKSLSEYSLETVRMFYDDAAKAGLTL